MRFINNSYLVDLDQQREGHLRNVATYHPDDKKATDAMTQLREIDKSFHWCLEFDDLVLSDKDYEAKFCNCLYNPMSS